MKIEQTSTGIPANAAMRLSELHGISAAPGLVIGTAFVAPSHEILDDEARHSHPRFRTLEKAALNEACTLVIKDLQSTCGADTAASLRERRDVFVALVQEVMSKGTSAIDLTSMTAVQTTRMVLGASISFGPEHLKADFTSIQEQIIAAIHGGNQLKREVPPNSVLVAEHLSAALLATLRPQCNIHALIAHHGGQRDHAAIVARDRGWPAVFRVDAGFKKIRTGDLLVVDGTHGKVFINPTPEELEHFRARVAAAAREIELRPINNRKVYTLDRHEVILTGTADSIDGVDDLLRVFPENGLRIGLFRTEFELTKIRPGGKTIIDNEDAQVELYRSVLAKSNGRPVTFRTVDWAPGDKTTCTTKERNPALGQRGLRYSLKPENCAQFRVQLRALLRATEFGRIGIMFPMVNDTEQFGLALAQFELARQELNRRGIVLGPENLKHLKIGIMAEVPAVVSELPKMVNRHNGYSTDFVSIGSSDLTQYTVAFDRDPSATTDARDEVMYAPHHPAVINKIWETVRIAQNSNIKISLCGEMASDPQYIPLLIGCGLPILSVSARGAWAIKTRVEKLRFTDCRALAESMLLSDGPVSSLKLLQDFCRERNLLV